MKPPTHSASTKGRTPGEPRWGGQHRWRTRTRRSSKKSGAQDPTPCGLETSAVPRGKPQGACCPGGGQRKAWERCGRSPTDLLRSLQDRTYSGVATEGIMLPSRGDDASKQSNSERERKLGAMEPISANGTTAGADGAARVRWCAVAGRA